MDDCHNIAQFFGRDFSLVVGLLKTCHEHVDNWIVHMSKMEEILYFINQTLMNELRENEVVIDYLQKDIWPYFNTTSSVSLLVTNEQSSPWLEKHTKEACGQLSFPWLHDWSTPVDPWHLPAALLDSFQLQHAFLHLLDHFWTLSLTTLWDLILFFAYVHLFKLLFALPVLKRFAWRLMVSWWLWFWRTLCCELVCILSWSGYCFQY